MKLVSMKIDAAAQERKRASMIEAAPGDSPAYPWGLGIHLEEEALEKLKLEALPEVGKSMMLMARVDVTGCSSSETKDGGKSRSISLQITDLALEPDQGEGHADKLYAKG